METTLVFRYNYEDVSDRDIIDRLVRPAAGVRPDEEGVAYLLYERYNPLLKSIYNGVFDKQHDLYSDCLADLYDYLHGEEPVWQKLRNFEWRCSFSTWLKTTAYRRFCDRKAFLIGKTKKNVSIDERDAADRPKLQLPDGGVEVHEGNERRVLVLEAIRRLRNEDQRFAVTRQLEGYSSKEIAELLRRRWEKHGIVRYGYVKVPGQKRRQKRQVQPDEKYVDSLMEHAREELRELLNKMV